MQEQSIFIEALEKADPAERAAFLDQICAGDSSLRRRLDRLLEHHQHGGSFLEPLEAQISAVTAAIPAECPGSLIGPYTLMEQIGEGGMGLVFVAEQSEPVRRKVALKVIKPGMDSRQVVARFEAERQALAIMDHPNIAKVFDGGATASGRPYFVMELVRGKPITDYCDENSLTPRERLELFSHVCAAVHHAHQKGIIHRDIKPSNVLVVSHDGTPVVKVIDFGVAKAIGGQLTDNAVYTNFTQFVGTPLYMSPEQAGQSGLDVDTRTDIYALGVLLYELLTGTTPFEKARLRDAAHDEIRRIIREEDPPKPSTRLNELTKSRVPSETSAPSPPYSGERAGVRGPDSHVQPTSGPTSTVAATISARRKCDSRQLYKVLRGDLDWIVMKALEKDRNRRYESASAFAADVGRYLQDEPVEACPPTRRYRLGKFLRKHRTGVFTAVALMTAALALGAGSVWVALDRAAQRAVTEELVGQAMREATTWQRQGRLPEAQSALRRAQGLAQGRPGSQELLDQVRGRLDELSLVEQLDDVRLRMANAAEADHFDFALADRLYAEAFQRAGMDIDNVAPEMAAAWIQISTVAGELAGMLDLWAETRRYARPPEDDGWRRLRRLATTSDPNERRAALRQALDSGDPAKLTGLAKLDHVLDLPPASLIALAWALERAGAHTEGTALLRAAWQRHADDFWVNEDLGCLLRLQSGAAGEAVRFLTAAVALRPASAGAHINLGVALLEKGDHDGAAAALATAVRLDDKCAAAHYDLGIVLKHKEDADGAIRAFQAALQRDPRCPEAHYALGTVLLHRKADPDGAVRALEAELKMRPAHYKAHYQLGLALKAKGDGDGAVREFEAALKINPGYVPARITLGNALRDRKDLEGALNAYQKASQLDPQCAEAHYAIGNVFRAKSDLDGAIHAYQVTIGIDSKHEGAHFNLANALAAKGDLEGAIGEYRAALRINPKSAAAHTNLGNALVRKGANDEAVRCYRKALEIEPSLIAARLNLGHVLQGQKLYAAAVEAYQIGDVLAAQRAGAGSQHLYDAACAAALAGCGQGKDAANLDETIRVSLRKQALAWLRADLADWRARLDKEPTKVGPQIQKTMEHWQQDADFDGVRGAAALAKLPEAERQEWQKLWEEVEELRKQAGEKL